VPDNVEKRSETLAIRPHSPLKYTFALHSLPFSYVYTFFGLPYQGQTSEDQFLVL